MTTPDSSETTSIDFSTITADEIRKLKYPTIRQYMDYKFTSWMPPEEIKILKDAALNGKTYLEGTWTRYWTYNLGLGFGAARIVTNDVCQLLGVMDVLPGQIAETASPRNRISMNSKARSLNARIQVLLSLTIQFRQLLKEGMGHLPDIEPFISPTTVKTFPFPYMGASKPVDSLNLFQNLEDDDQIYYFTFRGREMFKTILGEVDKLSSGRGYEGVWILGTKGSGKSIEMAKLALYLFAHSKPVIYIPNSRACAVKPVTYLQSAFILAYSHDPELVDEISRFNSKEDITRFVKSREDHEDRMYFIIDNYGALETKNRTDKPDDLKLPTRAVIREWLLELSAPPHHRILCSSSNHRSAHEMLNKDNSSGYLPIYMNGGYLPHEFNDWWRRLQDGSSGLEKKDQTLIEKITGKVPLLLEMVIKPGHTGDPWKKLEPIAVKACQFSENLQKTITEAEFSVHKEFVKGCILQSSVPLDIDYNLVDHRFFYRDVLSGTGRCTNLAVSDAMWRWMVAQQPGLFRARDFNAVIRSLPSSPSVVGFAVEAACLTSICSSGLPIAEEVEGVKVGVSILMKRFSSKYPVMFSEEAGATIHCPSAFNFPDIDAIICSREPEPRGSTPRRVTLIPIQITLDPNTHSDSESGFFRSLSKWKSGWGRNWRFKFIFVWIGGKEPEKDVVKEDSLGFEHPEFIRVTIPFEQLNPDIAITLSETNVKTGSKRKQKNTPVRKSTKKRKS